MHPEETGNTISLELIATTIFGLKSLPEFASEDLDYLGFIARNWLTNFQGLLWGQTQISLALLTRTAIELRKLEDHTAGDIDPEEIRFIGLKALEQLKTWSERLKRVEAQPRLEAEFQRKCQSRPIPLDKAARRVTKIRRTEDARTWLHRFLNDVFLKGSKVFHRPELRWIVQIWRGGDKNPAAGIPSDFIETLAEEYKTWRREQDSFRQRKAAYARWNSTKNSEK
jgi:hypothetical protein